MVKGLLAWLNKVFWVFKVFGSNSLVNNTIYYRDNNGNNKNHNKNRAQNPLLKCYPTLKNTTYKAKNISLRFCSEKDFKNYLNRD